MKTQWGPTIKSEEFKQLLIDIAKLSHQQRQKLAATLKQPADEAKALELIASQCDAKKACPHCACTELYRHGVVDNIQRYYCKQCHKTFNVLTVTPLARLREKPKWMAYLAAMARFLTVRKSAVEVNVHRNTSSSAPCGYPLAAPLVGVGQPRPPGQASRHHRSR